MQRISMTAVWFLRVTTLLWVGLGFSGDGVQGETTRKHIAVLESQSSRAARIHFGHGIDAFNAMRYPEAISFFTEAAAIDSHYRGSALFNLGLLDEFGGDGGSGDGEDGGRAQQLVTAAMEADSSPSLQTAAFNRLAILSAKRGAVLAAIPQLRRALELDPDDLLAKRNLIAALDQVGKKAEARAAFEELSAADPASTAPSLDQLQVMMQAGDPGLPGQGLMERWMECDLEASERTGWTDVVLPSCRIQDGERYLREGVEQDPTDINAWYQLGCFYRQHDMVWECVRAMTVALRLNSKHAPALAVMGGTLADNTNYTLAVGPLERALELHPGDLYARANIVLSLAWTCQWSKNDFHMAQFVSQLQGGINTDLKSFPAPAHMLFIIGTPPTDFPPALYRRWVDMWSEEMCGRIDYTQFVGSWPLALLPDLRLRVGWVSGAGFQKSPGSSAIRGVFAEHDAARFDVHCFALKPDLRSNDLRRNVSSYCHAFHDFGNVASDKQLAAMVNAAQPHIIIDVSGFSGDHRIKFLAHRPAPLSYTFCEYPGTLGQSTGIDGIITDHVASPPEMQLMYAEKLLSVPPPYLPNDYVATVGLPAPSQEPLPADESLVFCALHHVWKMDSQIFSVWMDLLLAVPGSSLRLQDCADEAKLTLRAAAESKGVDPRRLIFNPKIGDYYEHVFKLSFCALFLDAPKYNAHTSAADALWAGVPVVTVPHQMMVHRGAACLVYSTNVTQPIVRTIDDYRDVAIRLGTQPGALEAVRAAMRATRYSANMFDTRRWTKVLEAGMQMGWEAANRRGRRGSSAGAPFMHVIPFDRNA